MDLNKNNRWRRKNLRNNSTKIKYQFGKGKYKRMYSKYKK